jgi:hypothetical protein
MSELLSKLPAIEVSENTTQTARVDFPEEARPLLYPDLQGIHFCREQRIAHIIAKRVTSPTGEERTSWTGAAWGPAGHYKLSNGSVLYCEGDYSVVEALFEELGWPYPPLASMPDRM